MTVGYFAPPPPARTGVADYARTLLAALQLHGEVRENEPDARINLYHLGNNPLHEEIYQRALAEPGVVVLHDAVLHHFMLGRSDRETYLGEWLHNYGEWRRDLGEELWRERSSAGVDPRYFAFPLLRRIVERSRMVIVHNPGAAAMARSHGCENVRIIPHFFEPVALPDAAETCRFRERQRIPQGATLFGIFGYLRETKRVLACVRAFRRLHEVERKTALLIAGEPASADLDRLLQSEAAGAAVYRLGHLPEHEFWTAAAAVACCLNLRYPAAGETSGIAVRLMGIGKPVILSEVEENSEFPGTSCLRVRPGAAEAAELFDYLVLAVRFPETLRQIGREAARHIRQHHALDGIAAQYWRALCDATV